MARYAPLAALFDKIWQYLVLLLFICHLHLHKLSMIRAARLCQLHLALSIEHVGVARCQYVVALRRLHVISFPQLISSRYNSIRLRPSIHVSRRDSLSLLGRLNSAIQLLVDVVVDLALIDGPVARHRNVRLLVDRRQQARHIILRLHLLTDRIW